MSLIYALFFKTLLNNRLPLLPFEILRLTFTYLKEKDLLHCQLTSKNWYEASVELLYSKVPTLQNEFRFRFVPTISNSSTLGNYPKEINLSDSLTTPREGRFWDEHNLISALIQHCPNLRVLNSHSFWFQISVAVAQGYLTRLQVLPRPSRSDSLERYLYTVQLFKPTLTCLEVLDWEQSYGVDLNDL
ncbi:hypothetical protein BD770DRAFT_461448 [Pilaira anomala]|nr:hypothetical protein BD770DRAFT_461448 [Pilaira anomala]